MAKTRSLTIIAQDPSIRDGERILTTRVAVPYEKLGPGPRGYRAHVVDYDSSQRVLYKPADLGGEASDCFAKATDATLLGDPTFHAQNVYAIVMRILSRFEFALGRRIAWGFGGHQIHIAPHAFAEANAYYSEDDRGLFFGYFPGKDGKPVYGCLSHDVIAHETAHALVDGLRGCYTLPSGPDQAGFHEGFADIVALLSVFGLRGIVARLLPGSKDDPTRVDKADLTPERLKKSALLGLAEQFGKEMSGFRDDALRRSVELPPSKDAMKELPYEECHKRGEILSAAVLNAFVQVWWKRLGSWLPSEDKTVSKERVAEDGSDAAEQLQTMLIRALDYCPVVDITYADLLSAVLTADFELLPDDGKYKYRPMLLDQFKQWLILPASSTSSHPDAGEIPATGAWERPKDTADLRYDCVHLDSLMRDPDEVFRFVWENRKRLRIYEDAYTRVVSVRPCVRTGPDGFVLRETVSGYLQTLDLEARQLGSLGIGKPKQMPDSTPVRLRGGGVLMFDDFGHLKYHVRSRIDNAQRQTDRLDYLWRNGIRDEHGRYGFSDGAPPGRRFALMHLRRSGRLRKEEWDG
jgi:hypothetical protein